MKGSTRPKFEVLKLYHFEVDFSLYRILSVVELRSGLVKRVIFFYNNDDHILQTNN